jgi:hypothetical protein
MRSRAKTDAIALLAAINETQARGREGARADPAMAARRAGLEVGSERYRGAMAYLVEEAALLGDRHTAFSDEGDQHAHGYASYFFTERALALLEDHPGDRGHPPVAEGPSGSPGAS